MQRLTIPLLLAALGALPAIRPDRSAQAATASGSAYTTRYIEIVRLLDHPSV